MTFAKDKEKYLAVLGKPDRSKKGGVDEAAWPLINAINEQDMFYTTSSCAGRTNLFLEPGDGRKDHGHWHYVTHDENDFAVVQEKLHTLPSGEIWFIFEGAIFHVVAENEEHANRFLQLARESGFKHSGILGTKKRWIIEIIDSEKIHVPIATEGKLLVDESFVQFLTQKANEKLRITRERMEKLRKKVLDYQRE